MFFKKILWSFQGSLFRFPVSRPDDVVFRPDAHQSATSVQTTRSFRLDAHQCLEAWNSSRLHPSWRSSKFEKILVFQCIRLDDVVISSGRHSMFSASRHSYGKTAATVRTMFSIRQDVLTKFNRLDGSLHGPDDQASYMKIACTSSTVQTSAFRVWTFQSLIMVMTCSWSATVLTLGQNRPEVALLWKLSALFWKGGCSWPSRRSVKPSGHPPVFWS